MDDMIHGPLRRPRALFALAVAALMLPGCTEGATPAPTDVPTPARLADGTAWNRADRLDVREGGTLSLAIERMPSNFNPFRTLPADSDTRDIVATTLGGPFRIDESGAPVVDEDYASSADVTGTDPQIVEIRLNPDAVWGDGTPITVADYAATWMSANGEDEAYDPVSTAGWDQIESIEAGEDEHHVVVTFSSAFVDWQGLFTSVLKESVASDPAVFNDGFLTTPMPSAGPFVITDVDAAGGVVTAERNPLWWGETPKLDRVLFRAADRDEQGSLFADGDIDALRIAADAALYEQAEGVDGADIQAANGVAWMHVTLNAADGPLSDANVRKAIASVVDRERIAAASRIPVGAPGVTQDDYIFMAGRPGYADRALPYDLEAGAAFLADAGYAREGERWVLDGEALELAITVPAGATADIERAEQVQADLAAFGIPTELASVPTEDYFREHIIPGDFEMATFSWVGTAFPISSSEPLFHPVDSGQNVTAVTDEALGALWDRANAEPDPRTRIEIANEISERIWGYVPMLPIAPVPEVWAVADGLVNYGAAQFETVDWTLVGWAAE